MWSRTMPTLHRSIMRVTKVAVGCVMKELPVMNKHQQQPTLMPIVISALILTAIAVHLAPDQCYPGSLCQEASERIGGKRAPINGSACETIETKFLQEVALSSLESEIPQNAIHFIHSSGLPHVRLRELCAFESAALQNPETPVVINVVSQVLEWTEYIENVTKAYSNLMFTYLNLTERLSETPLGGDWLDRKGLLHGVPQFRPAHISDVVRIATVYKHGGAYLDHDMITVRSLKGFHNALTLEEGGIIVGANFVAFEKGHKFLLEYLLYLKQNFVSYIYAANGPSSITHLLKRNRWCKLSRGGEFTGNCRGNMQLLPAKLFNPLPCKQVDYMMFQNHTGSPDVLKKVEEAQSGVYSVHLFNSETRGSCIDSSSIDQPVARLMKENCPHVFSSARGMSF